MKRSVRSSLVFATLLSLKDEIYGFILQRFVPSKVSTHSSIASSSCCILADEFSDSEIETLSVQLNMTILSKEKLLSDPDCIFSHLLTRVPYQYEQFQDYALAIASLDRGSTGKNKKPKVTMKPFFVDFFPPSNSRLGKRVSGESGRDLLVKAVSLPNRGLTDVSVYDLTAGFGQDSLLIAKGGAKHVYMVERNPIVACLLKDALRRLALLSNAPQFDDQVRSEASRLANCLHLIQDDGIQVAKALTKADDCPDIIYLDPMFPERKKSASVKKNMQILHGLLGSQDVHLHERLRQEQALLLSSFEAARQRVIVKRPKSAPQLGQEYAQTSLGPTPTYALDGPVNRWDVYVK